jgi:hypothetical protein
MARLVLAFVVLVFVTVLSLLTSIDGSSLKRRQLQNNGIRGLFPNGRPFPKICISGELTSQTLAMIDSKLMGELASG